MKDNKTKNIIIVLLLFIVAILGSLVVLFATDTLKFNFNNDTSNNHPVENVVDNKEEINEEEKSKVRYYQSYEESNESDILLWSSREITLNTEGTAELHFNGTSVGGYDYKGTYIENNSQIILTLELITGNNEVCDPSTSVKECTKEITIIKNSDSTLTETYDLGNGSTETFNYVSVEENELKLPL